MVLLPYSSLLCTNSFTISISNDFNVYSIGSSESRAHGFSNKDIFPFKQIQGLINIKMISCSDDHTVCLNYDGYVFSFGSNREGQLGIGKDENELEFTHIPQKITLPPCQQVSCGSYFTMCLTEDNILYSFGNNSNGELGLGINNENYNSPQLIPNLDNIAFIICNGGYSICITYNNDYYSWGFNGSGQLGKGNNHNCNKPTQCFNWPDNIIDIKSGVAHSLLLTSEGEIYSLGWNGNGQLGINDKNIKSINIPRLIKDIPEIQRIECGNTHSVCIDINDNLWIFGDNGYGQLGLKDKKNKYKPTLHRVLSNIIDISSRGDHTFVKTIDNKIYAFGYNEYSQLGIKTSKEYQLTPIQVLEDNEDIWNSNIGKSSQKSARK